MRNHLRLGVFLPHPSDKDLTLFVKLILIILREEHAVGKACSSLISAFSSWRRWREVRKPLALQSFPLEAPSLPGLRERGFSSSPASLFLALERADVFSRVFFWGDP